MSSGPRWSVLEDGRAERNEAARGAERESSRAFSGLATSRRRPARSISAKRDVMFC
jgi:hypothetical protein